ncbi:MAG: transglutaminase-like domain-containing protein [Eubacteriaceae bacterium]|nr:transglutaminase-like domain-containing protein [Eubacteriaceae bacterium]
MDKLKFTEQKTLNKKNEILPQLALSVFFAYGILRWLADSLDFSLKIWEIPAGGVGSGLIYTWNAVADVLGKNNYILLEKLSGAGDGNGLFLAVIFLLLVPLVYYLIKSNRLWPVVVLLIILMLPQAVLALKVKKTTVAILLAGFLMVISFIKWSGKGFWKGAVFIAAVAILTLGVASAPGVNKAIAKPKAVQEINTAIQQMVHEFYYGTNPLKSGDLTQRQRDDSSDVALEIVMEKPQSMYLRGFIGEQYMKNRWQSLPESAHFENRELFYWLKQDGFNPLGQLGQANSITASDKEKDSVKEGSSVEIKVKDADKRYAYVPYEITSEGIQDSKNRSGSFITPSSGSRLKSYSYTTLDNSVRKWTDIASRVFTQADIAGISGDDTKKSNASQLGRYLIDESHYNALVYDKYTYLSEEEYLLLKNNIGKAGNQSKGHIDYKTAIRAVRKYLSDKFIYTEKLGNRNDDKTTEDVLKKFLESKKGYDIHYATAATMMFRYYGIPARYVEGYLVTPDDVKNAEASQPISISRKNAHAWVEIYIDGTGFVPIEVCPSYEGIMEEADMSIGISNNTLIRPLDSNKNNQHNSLTIEEAEEERSASLPIGLIIITLLLIMLLVLAVGLLRKLAMIIRERIKRNRLFKKGEPKLAVCAIFKYLEDKKLPINHKVRELGNKAAYSPIEISEEERGLMLTALKESKMEKKKDEKSKKNHRFIFNRRNDADA